MKAAPSRNGVILILVMGIVIMLGGLALAFITRVRSDALEMTIILNMAQSRVMLSAACSYVLESGRIGWDDPSTPEVEEASGWVDVRSGEVGPRAPNGLPLFSDLPAERITPGGGLVRPRWPAINSVVRCPMTVFERPPYALDMNTTPNPIETDPSKSEFGVPLLVNREPWPVVADATAAVATRWQEWSTGDRLVPGLATSGLRIRTNGDQGSWFRVFRDSPATFIITAGSGGTRGFKNWDEVLVAGAGDQFAFDPTFFEQILDREARIWYRIEWSPAIQSTSSPYRTWNALEYNSTIQRSVRRINQAGTIAYIQRLRFMPRDW